MTHHSPTDELLRRTSAEAGAAYGWMALTAFVVIVAGKLLFPFPDRQRAQNVSLAIEGAAGAALGLALKSRYRSH